MGEDEEGTLNVLQDCRALIDRLLAQHEGRLFGSAGDSVVVEFPSALEAVRCGIDLQAELARRRQEQPAAAPMQFRVGINLGDVLVDDEDNLFGDGVNVAARVQALAEPGGICITGSVFDQIESRLPVAAIPMGERRLKNIAKPVRLYRLDLGSLPMTAGPARGARRWLAAGLVALALLAVGGAAWTLLMPSDEDWEAVQDVAARKPWIAVLPFDSLVAAEGRDYFSDGITDDIITALSRFPELSVIAADAVAQYRGDAVSPQQIGADLGVRYLLTGSVRREGDRIRVTAQLSDTTTGQYLWSDSYDRTMDDVFAVQDDITRHVVAMLVAKVARAERELAFSKPTENLAAYDYVLQGQAYLAVNDRPSNGQAEAVFQQAIALDPGYAAAHAGLGWTYFLRAASGWTEFRFDALTKAERLTKEALRLDDSLPSAHRLLGYVHLFRQEYELAIDRLERALEINPSDAESYAVYGAVLTWSGRTKDAIAALETALRLNPSLGPNEASELGLAYYLDGRYEDAVQLLTRAIERNPDNYFLSVPLVAALVRLSRDEDAARAAQEVLRLWPFFDADVYAVQIAPSAARDRLVADLRSAGLP